MCAATPPYPRRGLRFSRFFPYAQERRTMLAILFALLLSQATLDDSPAAVEEGLRVYRSKCARCHDLNGQGYRGADLTQLQRRNFTNAQLASLISRGIPGTDMPA